MRESRCSLRSLDALSVEPCRFARDPVRRGDHACPDRARATQKRFFAPCTYQTSLTICPSAAVQSTLQSRRTRVFFVREPLQPVRHVARADAFQTLPICYLSAPAKNSAHPDRKQTNKLFSLL